ncbi:MAG: dienelactone hydrolase family protein, partial [Acidiferrobacterales bacterium]|nr:dienelactone hydrolase family protein [Acidiferrobacterales bacterium]
YCLGGKLAYLMATRSDADCNVSYYGVSLQDLLDEVINIKQPLMLHIAEEDQSVPKEAQAKITSHLANHPQVTIHKYPRMGHAFARVGGQHYNKTAADTANQRTAEFFKQHLS